MGMDYFMVGNTYFAHFQIAVGELIFELGAGIGHVVVE